MIKASDQNHHSNEQGEKQIVVVGHSLIIKNNNHRGLDVLLVIDPKQVCDQSHLPPLIFCFC